MKNIRTYEFLSFVFFCFVVLVACDREAPQPKLTEVEETIVLSMESLVDGMVAKDKADIEEAQKQGRRSTVGLAEGKWWQEADGLERAVYLRAVADLTSAVTDINLAVYPELRNQGRAKGLKPFVRVGGTYDSGYQAESFLTGRIGAVIGGHSFGDISDAVTKFYQNKPLLKDKPVIWVLAVPLYKEFQESQPKEKRSTAYDSLWVPMQQEVKQ